MSAYGSQSGATKRAVIISVLQFSAAEAQPPLEDLPVPPALIDEIRRTFCDLGYDTAIVDASPLPSKDLGAAVREQWELAGADDLLIVHVLSHGHPADGEATVYVMGSDGVIDESTDVAHWLTSLQNVKGRPLTLLLLDLCSSGTAARLPWQQELLAEDSRAWVIAACPPSQAAFDGRFTQAVAKVLRSLRDGELDTDPARKHVPLPIVARAIRREVNELTKDGYSQQVTASLVDLSADPELPFFSNPHYRANKQVRLRAAVDPGLLPFVDDLDEGLDPRHFLERAAGVGGLADLPGEVVGCFTGRDRELTKLSWWMNDIKDESLSPGTLCVVTGSPGVGKSALLGILVCAAHDKLRAPTKPVWDRARPVPNPVNPLAAVHARGRSTASVAASVARQLVLGNQEPGTGNHETLTGLTNALRESTGPAPVIVVDALDEADDGPGLMTEMMLPLSAMTRPNGDPAARLLVGVRQYDEYTALLAAAAAKNALINLDDVPTHEVEDNLNRYVIDLLRTTTAYRHRGDVTGAFAERLASVLTTRDGDVSEGVRWGPFLVAGLYTRHIIATTAQRPIRGAAQAKRAANSAPRDLPAVLELDLQARTGQPWLRAVMSVLARARGQGMPMSVLARCAAAFADAAVATEQPSMGGIRETLDAARVYLRQSVDRDGTTVYRLFHQGLADALGSRPFSQAADLLDAMLRPLGPPQARDWDAAEPYVLRHVVDHAEDAGMIEDVLSDPGLLLRPEAAGLLHQVDLAGHPRLQAIAAVQEDSAAQRSRLGWALTATRLGLADLAVRAANLQPPLPWQPVWTFPGDGQVHGKGAAHASPECWELARQDSPILMLDMSANGSLLVSYDELGRLRTWDTDLGSTSAAQLSTVPATSLGVSASGRHVITGDAAGVIRVWNLVAGGSRRIESGNHPLVAVAVSDDARQMRAFCDDGTLLSWEPGRRQSRRTPLPQRFSIEPPPAQSDQVVHLVTPPGGQAAKDGMRYLAETNARGMVRLTASSGEIVIPDGIHDGRITSVAWSAAAMTVVCGLEDGTVLLWDVNASRTKVITEHDGPVLCVAISSDGQTTASGGADGSLRMCSPTPSAAGERASEGVRTRAGARSMTVAGNAVAVVGGAADVYPLDLATGKPLQAPLNGRQRVAGLSARVIDGHHGALLHHSDGTSSLWLAGADSLLDVGTWQTGRPDAGRRVFVLDGRLAEVAGEAGGTLIIRDVAADQEADQPSPSVPDGPSAVVACARLGGQPIAATCDVDGESVHVWDVAGPGLTATIEVGARIWGVELSADGYLVVGAGSEVIAFRHVTARQRSSP